jgi:hypothetical protein
VDGENRGQHDRAVVRALRSLEPLTGPTAAERRRMRDRVLLALDAESNADDADPLAEATLAEATPDEVPTPRAADGDDEPAATHTVSPRPRRAKRSASRPTATRRRTRPDTGRSVFAGARGRFVVASLALLTLVGSLVGMSVLLARDALPGDALYGVKRTAEAASLGLTFGDESKALKHLEFAASRITEIETLARRYANPADAPVGGYLTALTDFDNDAIAGTRQLIAVATRADGRLLDSLRDWSAQQADRLRQVDGRLPSNARNRASASRALLDHITTRADALLTRMDCYEITSGSFDDIGALPATAPCEKKPATTSTEPRPGVPVTPDTTPVSPTGPATPSQPLPPAQQTPGVPPVPVPGATVSVPAPDPRSSGPSDPDTPTTTTAPPLIELPPLLPGLPGVSIG